MNTIQNSSIPPAVSRVTSLLKSSGFESHIVGGCVRDLLMGKTPKDWDITTNAHPEDIISVFEKAGYRVVYENTFGTVMVINESEPNDSTTRQIEITPYRSDGVYLDNRHPDSVSFSTELSEDLKRRDFTMNAIAYDVENQKITDIFGGLKDITDKRIHCVGNAKDRLSEDALRIMRAIRFSAQLNFSVSHETIDAMFHVKHLINNVSRERIRDELVKMINTDSPSVGIVVMKQLGILELIIPELLEGAGCEQGGAHKFDVFDHLVQAFQHAADKKYSFHVKLAALFHDIGKPRTKRQGKLKPTFYGHEVVGANMVQQIMDRLKFPKSDTEIVVKLVRYHMFFSDTEQITLSAVRRMIQNVSQLSPEALEKLAPELPIWTLMKVRECDRVGMAKTEAPFRLRKYHAMIEQCLRDPISVSQLAIDGNYLMKELHVKPGPRMGWMLHALLEEVLEDPAKNSVGYLSKRVSDLENLPDAELRELGEQGRQKKENLEEQEVKELHVKHGVMKGNTVKTIHKKKSA